MQIRAFESGDTEQVVALWQACGLVRPWNDPHLDIARKLTVQPELFLVGVDGDSVSVSVSVSVSDDASAGAGAGDRASDRGDASTDRPVIASVMVGFDGHRGWVNYLSVDPGCRGRGHARALMREAERLLVARCCPKLNLQVRQGNESVMGFYRALGYEPDHAVSLGKRLIADD